MQISSAVVSVPCRSHGAHSEIHLHALDEKGRVWYFHTDQWWLYPDARNGTLEQLQALMETNGPAN